MLFVVILLLFRLKAIDITRPLIVVRKACLKHSFRVVIIPPLNAIRVVSFFKESRDILLATLSSDNNRRFIREDNPLLVLNRLILSRESNLVPLCLLYIRQVKLLRGFSSA